MDAQNKICSYGNGATFFFKVFVYGRTDGQTYGQSPDNHNFLDQWVTKFSKVWGSPRTPLAFFAGALV